ncbi:MAG TPA: (Fe-S)-binding protein, partial [Bacteroidota bacterium]|nr:(Fe-S)-binding protein [Bacteroidota bacterium]
MMNGFTGIDIPSDDVITNCMHCGLCLPTCPTYALTGRERSSPRGRIRLIKAVAEGDLSLTQGFIDEMDFCLDCQACETACPAGVKYGSLVESARNQIAVQGKDSLTRKIVKSVFLKNVLSNRRRLKFVATLLRFYQRSGFERIMRNTGLLRFISPHFDNLQNLSPRIDAKFFDDTHPEILTPNGAIRHRVGFLSGCIMNVAFSQVNDDTVQVLLHNDCEVIIPRDQRCCGSMQAHNGDFNTARELARRNIDIFARYDIEYIVMNSAGCGAMMKEYGDYLKDDPAYKEKAERFAAKVLDLTEFLALIDWKKPDQPFEHRVAYHDACHLAHAQKVTLQPRMLLAQIPGMTTVELPESTWCCGSAGTYNMTHYEDSMKILRRKMEHIRSAQVEYVVTGNPGCLAQMEYGCGLYGVDVKIVHFAS